MPLIKLWGHRHTAAKLYQAHLVPLPRCADPLTRGNGARIVLSILYVCGKDEKKKSSLCFSKGVARLFYCLLILQLKALLLPNRKIWFQQSLLLR